MAAASTSATAAVAAAAAAVALAAATAVMLIALGVCDGIWIDIIIRRLVLAAVGVVDKQECHTRTSVGCIPRPHRRRQLHCLPCRTRGRASRWIVRHYRQLRTQAWLRILREMPPLNPLTRPQTNTNAGRRVVSDGSGLVSSSWSVDRAIPSRWSELFT